MACIISERRIIWSFVLKQVCWRRAVTVHERQDNIHKAIVVNVRDS